MARQHGRAFTLKPSPISCNKLSRRCSTDFCFCFFLTSAMNFFFFYFGITQLVCHRKQPLTAVWELALPCEVQQLWHLYGFGCCYLPTWVSALESQPQQSARHLYKWLQTLPDFNIVGSIWMIKRKSSSIGVRHITRKRVLESSWLPVLLNAMNQKSSIIFFHIWGDV